MQMIKASATVGQTVQLRAAFILPPDIVYSP